MMRVSCAAISRGYARGNSRTSIGRIPQTNADRRHLLPLPAPLVTVLEALPRVDGNRYVFVGRDDTGHLVDLKRAWDRIRDEAGIPDVRIHDLRRTVGSWLAGSGE